MPRPASPGRRRACRAVLAGVALFVASQLLIGQVAEHTVRLRDPLFGDKFARLRKKLAAAPDPAVVVMFGSSRTGLGFHGKVLERQLSTPDRPVVAFNYGTPAAGPVTHLVYFNRLLARGVRPSLVLMEVLPSMLADGHGGPVERHWFQSDRLTYSERATVLRYGFDPREVNPRWWRSVLVPSQALRFQLASRVVPSWLPWQVRFDWSRGSDECGWGTSQAQAVGEGQLTRGIAQATAEYGATLAAYTPGGPAAAALADLLAVCRAEGVPAHMVLMPEGATFRALLPAAGDARLVAFLTELQSAAGVGLTDARGWLPDDSFYDGHHMFARGAEAFTRRLGREVVAPCLGATPERPE